MAALLKRGLEEEGYAVDVAGDGADALHRGTQIGYDAIVLLAPNRADDAHMVAALKPLIGAIPVTTMREANYRVDRDTGKQSPDAAARWLEARIGLGAR